MVCPVVISDLCALHLIDEVTWGTKPGSPTRIWVPVSSYDVKLDVATRQSQLFVGNSKQHHSRKTNGTVQGNLTAPMFGWEHAGSAVSIAEYLYTWGFADPADACARASKTAEWTEGPDLANREHNGLRVNTATLSGDSSSGQITISLDLMGKDEVALVSAATPPTATNGLVDFSFEDAVISLGGSVVEVKSFSWKQENNLVAEFASGSDRPYLLIQNEVKNMLSITLNKADDTYAALIRAAAEATMTGEIVVSGPHAGTGASGTNTVLTIAINKLVLLSAPSSFSKGQIATEQLEFIAIKPSGTDPVFSSTWSLA